MTRLLALLLVAASLVAAPARAAGFVCAPPRCQDVAVPVPAGLKVPEARVRVLLPMGYDGVREYPVLYLYHGVGDTFATWTNNTDVDQMTRGLDLIVVMPDSGRGPDAGWYSDWVDDSRDWETFHIAVMIPYIDGAFATLGDGHRAVAGLSMGGFGAMHDAARNPGLFELAASFSGAVDTRYLAPASGLGFKLAHDRFGTPDERIWGDQLLDEQIWRAHNPTDLVEQLRGTELLIATGNGLPGGRYENTGDPGGYAVEQVIWQMNLSFVRALDAARVPHTDNFYGAGQHGWPYWEDALAWALPHIMAAIA